MHGEWDGFSIGAYIMLYLSSEFSTSPSSVREFIEPQQLYEDLLLGPTKGWDVIKADEDDIEDAIIKFKPSKDGGLLAKVKYNNKSASDWFKSSVNTRDSQVLDGHVAAWQDHPGAEEGYIRISVWLGGDGRIGGPAGWFGEELGSAIAIPIQQ